MSEHTELRMNRSMPQCTIIPLLGYADVPRAADWLCRVFGFTVRLRIADHRIQLSYGEGCLVITGLGGAPEEPSSEIVRNNDHSVMVRVVDADSHYEHAKQSGAFIVNEPATYPYGERQYTARDLAGRYWTFSQTLSDVDPKTWGGTPGD